MATDVGRWLYCVWLLLHVKDILSSLAELNWEAIADSKREKHWPEVLQLQQRNLDSVCQGEVGNTLCMLLLHCGTLSIFPNFLLMPWPGRSLFPTRNKHHTTRRHLRAFDYQMAVLSSPQAQIPSLSIPDPTNSWCQQGQEKMWLAQDGILSACSLMPKEVFDKGHFTHTDTWSWVLSCCFWKTDTLGATDMCPKSLVRSLLSFIHFLLGSFSECLPIAFCCECGGS